MKWRRDFVPFTQYYKRLFKLYRSLLTVGIYSSDSQEQELRMLIKTRHQGLLTVVHILQNLGAFELFEKLFFPATNFEYVDNWTSFLANVRSTRFFDNLPRQCYVITNIMGKIKISSKVGQDQKTLILIYLFILFYASFLSVFTNLFGRQDRTLKCVPALF